MMTPRIPSSRRRFFLSPLFRNIIMINFIAIAILFAGLTHLGQYRQTLLNTMLFALIDRAQIVSFLVSRGYRVSKRETLPISIEDIRHELLSLPSQNNMRIRIFDNHGMLIEDSLLLADSQQQALLVGDFLRRGNDIFERIGLLYDRLSELFMNEKVRTLYSDVTMRGSFGGDIYQEIRWALEGRSTARARRTLDGTLLLNAAAPFNLGGNFSAVLLLTSDGSQIDHLIAERRQTILLLTLAALSLTTLLSLHLTRTLVRPINMLAQLADRIPSQQENLLLHSPLRKRKDEIGDLANRLYEMTEALRQRYQSIANFADDVAHELKNPLSSISSATETAMQVTDSERRNKLMRIVVDDIQRLNHLITDISQASRVDAEIYNSSAQSLEVISLLQEAQEVMSFSSEQEGITLNSSIYDCDRHLRVRVVPSLMLQVLRNLISNALSFSPRGSMVTLSLAQQDHFALISVIDQGPGIDKDEIDRIFKRFYTSRSYEKCDRHSGLGLAIAQQIVEAHHGSLCAENVHDENGEIKGACFAISLPLDAKGRKNKA